MKKILLTVLGIVTINLCSFAIESDFKNSLLKVDYVKTGADSYNIRLFTQKPYNEPIKVIKKTNTSYYILLPETFHSIGSVAPTGDIKSTEVKLFPYAGQDLNNGYTKISIFTSKPLNIRTQLSSSSNALAPSIDPKKLSQLDSAFNSKQAQINEAQRQAQYAAQQKQIQEQKRIAAQKAQQEAQRQAQLKAQQEAQARAQAAREQQERQAQIRAQQEAQARAQAQKQAQLKAQQEAQRQAQIRAQQEAQAAKARQEKQAQLKAQQEAQARAQAQKQAQEAHQQTQQKQTTMQNTNNLQVLDTAGKSYEQGTNEKKFDTESMNKAPAEIVTQDITNNPEVNQAINEIPEAPNSLENKADIKEIIKDKLKPLFRRLKPYYYILKDNLTLVAALAIAFIGILILAAISKNKKKGTNANMEAQETTNDIEKPADENIFQSNEDLQIEPVQETPVQEVEEEYVEPEILSSVEIAANRGFMLIERQGTKALFGYINEDVFLLYQFKEFISNYEIKFRISEKQDDKIFFIVKVDNLKLLVRVTKSSMKLELEM